MSQTDAAIERASRERPDLVVATAMRRPKAWGALTARGTLAFREISGRAATDTERRAIWAGLWSATERTRTCGHELDPRAYATCTVCEGLALCLDCARAHFCTSECAVRSCIAGLCVKVVRDGVLADRFGVV